MPADRSLWCMQSTWRRALPWLSPRSVFAGTHTIVVVPDVGGYVFWAYTHFSVEVPEIVSVTRLFQSWNYRCIDVIYHIAQILTFNWIGSVLLKKHLNMSVKRCEFYTLTHIVSDNNVRTFDAYISLCPHVDFLYIHTVFMWGALESFITTRMLRLIFNLCMWCIFYSKYCPYVDEKTVYTFSCIGLLWVRNYFVLGTQHP